MKTIIVLQGGGALGAFACGAWKTLVPLLRDSGSQIAAIGGASIGAINAAVIARHHAAPDAGAGALESLWRDRLATPSLPLTGIGSLPWPFSPPAQAHGDVQSWNGVLTGLCVGTRGLYQVQASHAQPMAALHRVRMPLFGRGPMLQTLQDIAPSYRSTPGTGPLLGVAATDMLEGELQVFDSDQLAITPEHLAASSAIPLLFEPVTIDGRLYCDGDMCRYSMLPHMLRQGQAAGRWSADEALQLVTIEPIPKRQVTPPESGLELLFRTIELMQIDKLDSAQGELRDVNFQRIVRVRREPMPNDTISGQFDYSPARIDALIAQGERAAEAAWRAALVPDRTYPANNETRPA